MRRALNENPVVQAALIAVLAIGVAILLLTRMGGGGEAEEPAAPATAGAAATRAGAHRRRPTPPRRRRRPTRRPTPPGVPATKASGFVAGPGLPEDVVKAYDDGKTVVAAGPARASAGLLLACGARQQALRRDRRHAGGDDRARDRQAARPADTALFITHASNVAAYSRITDRGRRRPRPGAGRAQPQAPQRRRAAAGDRLATASAGPAA